MTNTNEHKPKAVAAEAPQVKIKSKGEKFFDWAVYGGIAWVGAFVATVPLAHYLSFGKGQWLHKGLSKWTERGINLVRANRNNSALAEEVAMTTSLMMGGNAMLIPVGVAEHYKVPIVEKLNQVLGDNTPSEQIEKSPRQTWWSLIEGRIVAWVAVFAAFTAAAKLVPNTLSTFKDEVGKLLCSVMNKPVRRNIGGTMEESTTYRYGKIGALDIFAVTAAATLLYIGGHFFARKQEQKKEVRAARHQASSGETMRDEVIATTTNVEESLNKAEPSAKIGGDKQHHGLIAAASEMRAGITS